MPKATNLKGEYCQTCAETLDAHMKDPKDVIVLDAECLKVFKSSGDYETIRSGDFKGEKVAAERSHEGAEKPGFVDRVRSKVKSAKGE